MKYSKDYLTVVVNQEIIDKDSETMCKTVGGPRSNTPCVFPFNFKGKLYQNCTSAEYTQYWCATKVGANHSYIDNEWGNCNSDCFDQGISFKIDCQN